MSTKYRAFIGSTMVSKKILKAMIDGGMEEKAAKDLLMQHDSWVLYRIGSEVMWTAELGKPTVPTFLGRVTKRRKGWWMLGVQSALRTVFDVREEHLRALDRLRKGETA